MSNSPASRTTTWSPRIAWLVIGLVLGAGIWAMTGGTFSRGTAPRAASSTWTAARLGGPAFANRPRVSPDGKLVAFVAMVDGLSQVAVIVEVHAGREWEVSRRMGHEPSLPVTLK